MWDQKINFKKKNIVLFVYVIILSLIGPIIFWVSNKENTNVVKLNKPERAATKNINILEKIGSREPINLQDRFSLGEKILVSADTNPQKQAGVIAFANGDYSTAHTQFLSSLQVQGNDPEALIYANNAIAALQKNELRIGLSIPIGGNLNVAKEILRGVAQAQHEINKSGGVNGRFIKVQIANDDNNPELAKQIASEFVQDKKIIAVVGHNDSNSSMAAAPIYNQGGLVMITPTSSAKNLTQIGDHIFRSTPSTRGLADQLAEYAVNSARKTNIAICSDSTSRVSTSFKEEFTWAVYEHGGKIVSTQCDFSAADFNAFNIPSKAVSDGADALLLAPSVVQINQAIEVARANKGRLSLLGNHSTNTYNVLQQGQSDVNGMVSVVAWYPDQNSANSPFVQEAVKLWGGSGNWRTAMAYDATKVLVASFRSGSTNRHEVQKVMANPYFAANGATDEIKFMPSGDRNMKGTLIRVQPGKKSGTGYDFASIKNQK